MVFRRPRVNVKPNVQSSRPVSTTAPAVPSDAVIDQPAETTESAPTVVEDSFSNVSQNESTPPVAPEPVPSPVMSEETPPVPVAKAVPPAVRPVFRRKPVPNIGARPGAAIHRR